MQILQKLNRRDRTQTKLITHCGTRSFRTCRAQIGWTLTVILNTMISLEKRFDHLHLLEEPLRCNIRTFNLTFFTCRRRSIYLFSYSSRITYSFNTFPNRRYGSILFWYDYGSN